MLLSICCFGQTVMSIQWLNDESDGSSNELPWLKDYLKQFPSDSTEREVRGLFFGANGVLVLTIQWKVFIFNRQRVCPQLKEAAEVWISYNDPLPRLVAKPIKGAKVVLGLDDSFVDWYWEKLDEGKFAPKLPGGSMNTNGTPKNTENTLNPFLPGSTPPKPRLNGKKSSKQSNIHPDGSGIPVEEVVPVS